ncbi:MAG: hypothetical protein HQ515_06835 [Phycisphaeraceae bacterium]|nr:hypothetical protein [Phycisphaeraceae bacterium]
MTKKTLDALLNYVRENGRVCPKPPLWNDLWKMLPNRIREGSGWHPPLPLILAAWYETSDMEKAERLELHIRYAYEKTAIAVVDNFLRNLDEESWVHRGEV